jgi:hypothetical protein
MFLILFLILAISCYSQNTVYSIKGQFLAEKIVEEKASAGFNVYYVVGKWVIVDWRSGEILVDGKRKKFADSIYVTLGSSMWKNNRIILGYDYPSWDPPYYIFEFDPVSESFTSLDSPNLILVSLNDVIYLPSKQIIASAFLGGFRTWIFYFNGDTLKLNNVNLNWAAGWKGKMYEMGDVIIGIGSNPTGLGTYEILGGYATKRGGETNWFLEDIIEYHPKVGGDIVGNKLFIAAAGRIYVFNLSNFNLLKKHILFNVKVESEDMMFIDDVFGYLVFSLDSKTAIYKFAYLESKDTVLLIDSLFIDGSFLSRFKRFDNDIYLILSNSEKVRVYKIDKVTTTPKEPQLPNTFTLYQNYPNPFNPTTTIEFDIPERTNVKLVIYDILGREVETLIDKELEPGKYKLNFTATNLPSGVYFYTLKTPKFTKTNKMLLIK